MFDKTKDPASCVNMWLVLDIQRLLVGVRDQAASMHDWWNYII